jgi:hypothetical protein
MAIKRYVLTVGDEAQTTIADLVAGLGAAGFVVEQTLDAIGVIVGLVDEAAVEQIRALPGVAAIDEDGTVTT